MKLLVFAFLLVAACTSNPSVDSKFGTLNPARTEYVPSRLARGCSIDADCVEVESGCHPCCPGGSAVNRKYADIFERNLRLTCEKTPAPRAGRECTCVRAPVRCMKNVCTWDYSGPDPNAL